jgi:hypothetical protein
VVFGACDEAAGVVNGDCIEIREKGKSHYLTKLIVFENTLIRRPSKAGGLRPPPSLKPAIQVFILEPKMRV